MNHWTPATEGKRLRAVAACSSRSRRSRISSRSSAASRTSTRARPDARDHAGHLALVRAARASATSRTAASRSTRSRREHIGQDTPLPSLEVATEEAGGGGACDRNYGCSYGAHDLVPHADDAAADGVQSAQAVPEACSASGDTPEERERARGAVREHARHGRGQGRGAAEGRSAPSDRAHARRLSRQRARDRAARAEDRRRTICRTSTLPDVPVGIPSSFDEQMNLMFDTGRARVPGQHDAHHVVHDGGRGQQHDVQPRRRARRVPPAVASPEQRREAGAAACACRRYHTQVFARVRDRSSEDMPDGERLDARQLDLLCTAAT